MVDGPSGSTTQGGFNIGQSIIGGALPIIFILVILVAASAEQAMELLKNPLVIGGLILFFLLWVRR